MAPLALLPSESSTLSVNLMFFIYKASITCLKDLMNSTAHPNYLAQCLEYGLHTAGAVSNGKNDFSFSRVSPAQYFSVFMEISQSIRPLGNTDLTC